MPNDNVLVYGKDKDEHDVQLKAVLDWTGVTLNKEKCKFGKLELLFLGHQINQHGVQADAAKTSAIQNMCSPVVVSEKQCMVSVRLVGRSMTRHMSIFI